ncbi:right-handed parallel beta-helix repeat-containing protein, partial [Escherichia coli]
MHTDALGLSDCTSVTLENNLLKDLGEEPIAVRGGRHITIQNNELTNHQGDGILLKTGVNREAYDILIVNNHIHDGHKPAKPAGAGHTQRGGGVTLNNEVTGTPHSFTNLTVANNHIV